MENSPTKLESLEDVGKQEYYEMSPSQKRLWLIDQLNSDLSAYNIFSIFPIDEFEINKKSLMLAFRMLSKRHEILRTTFPVINGKPVQKINSCKKDSFEFKYFDVSQKSKPINRLRQLGQDQLKTSFDLANGPLLKVQLVKMYHNRFIILIFLHHIITDGWSMELLKRELLYIYHCIEQKKLINLPKLKNQYKDFTHWHHNQINGEKAKFHKNYWKHLLKGNLPRIELPFIKTRSSKQTFKGDSLITYLDEHTTKMLKTLNVSQGVSYFTLLIAILKLTLSKLTGEKDIIIGTNTSNLRLYGFENNIGLFLDTIVLRNYVNHDQKFSEFLKNIHANLTKAFQHQVYPLNKIIQDIRYQRDYSRNPIFDVLVTMQNHSNRDVELPINHFRSLNPESFPKIRLKKESSIVDLDFGFKEKAEGTIIGINFNTNLYDRSDIEKFAIQLVDTAIMVAKNPQNKICNFNILNEKEKLRLKTFYNTPSLTSKTLNSIELFKIRANSCPDATLITINEKIFTYSEIDDLSEKVSIYLLETFKLYPTSRIGVLMSRSEAWIIYLIAIMKAGMIYVPIDPLMPVVRVNYIVKNSRLTLVISDENIGSKIHGCRFQDSKELMREAKSLKVMYNLKVPDEESIAYIIYTSGSTGSPKGVMISHKSLSNYIKAFTSYFRIGAKDNLLQQASIGFDTSLEEVLPIMCVGGKICISTQPNNQNKSLVEYIRDEKVSIVSATPFTINKLNKASMSYFKSLRMIISGGDRLKKRDIDNLFQKVPIFNSYGPTEATICSTFHSVTNLDQIAIIGKPILGCNISILDDNNNPIPIGQIGEICISGKGICKGYDNANVEYDKKFIDDPFDKTCKMFRSGDLGKWTESGEIEFVGRNDTQLKINGARLELKEIELAIMEYATVLEVLVVPSFTFYKDQEIFLIAYCTGSVFIDTDEIRFYLSQKLPLYMIPRYFINIKSWPVSPNGKIIMKKLPVPSENFISSITKLPESSIQNKILNIWKIAFGEQNIGISDNFFELGGHSILAMEITHKIQKQTRVFITFADLFKNPTVEKLALLTEDK